jgi:hypothetical protein
MAAFWAVFTFGGSGPAITAHGSLDLKQKIQIKIQINTDTDAVQFSWFIQTSARIFCSNKFF